MAVEQFESLGDTYRSLVEPAIRDDPNETRLRQRARSPSASRLIRATRHGLFCRRHALGLPMLLGRLRREQGAPLPLLVLQLPYPLSCKRRSPLRKIQHRPSIHVLYAGPGAEAALDQLRDSFTERQATAPRILCSSFGRLLVHGDCGSHVNSIHHFLRYDAPLDNMHHTLTTAPPWDGTTCPRPPGDRDQLGLAGEHLYEPRPPQTSPEGLRCGRGGFCQRPRHRR